MQIYASVDLDENDFKKIINEKIDDDDIADPLFSFTNKVNNLYKLYPEWDKKGADEENEHYDHFIEKYLELEQLFVNEIREIFIKRLAS